MLSRFSRIPSYRFTLSSLASSITGKSQTAEIEYPKDKVDETISEIKLLGKKAQQYNNNNGNNAINHQFVVADIRRILQLMKEFEGSLQVQRVACHALSNLAM
jgi:hypothetical protein